MSRVITAVSGTGHQTLFLEINEDKRELADAVEVLKDAGDRVADALRAYLARDPVTGRPVHGRIGRAAQITRWGERRVRETATPALAEHRRARRLGKGAGQ
ncbi:hypothetical protein [Streptomyces sp. NPDC055140]